MFVIPYNKLLFIKMNKYVIVLITLITILIILFVVLPDSRDTGDFTILYSNGADKFKYDIEKGVNRWARLGTGGILLRFTTLITDDNYIAIENNRLIKINIRRYERLSRFMRILVITHEVGHALGIGHWSLIQPNQNGVSYLGGFPETQKAYIDQIRPENITLPGPPLASADWGPGSAIVHWSPDNKFGLERDIMVPELKSSTNVISIIDLTVLKELGIKVDLSQAEDLKVNYYSSIIEYIYGDETIKHGCGNCN